MTEWDYDPSGKTLKDRIERGGIKDQYFQEKYRHTGFTKIYRVVHIQTSQLDLLVSYLNSDGTERNDEGSEIRILDHLYDPHLIRVEK